MVLTGDMNDAFDFISSTVEGTEVGFDYGIEDTKQAQKMQWMADGVFGKKTIKSRRRIVASDAPGKSKKFAVLAKSGSKVRLVRFGDPNMRIRKSNPARRKSFRARHKCATAKNKLTARYWSCKKW